MTREQILRKYSDKHGSNFCYIPEALKAMQEFADQEVAKEREKHKKEIDRILSAIARGENLAEALNFDGKSELQKERERAAKLVSDLDKLAEIYKAEGRYVSWSAIKQITGSYRNNIPPETTGNKTAC